MEATKLTWTRHDGARIVFSAYQARCYTIKVRSTKARTSSRVSFDGELPFETHSGQLVIRCGKMLVRITGQQRAELEALHARARELWFDPAMAEEERLRFEREELAAATAINNVSGSIEDPGYWDRRRFETARAEAALHALREFDRAHPELAARLAAEQEVRNQAAEEAVWNS